MRGLINFLFKVISTSFLFCWNTSKIFQIKKAMSQLPKWHQPTTATGSAAKLKIFNSFTKQKDEFIPVNPLTVNWYTCGPTGKLHLVFLNPVYAPSHLGHARAFLTSDIIRRIMQDYFQYNVNFVMNITDIDDKIILAARYRKVFTDFTSGLPSTLEPSLIKVSFLPLIF
jgi:hypothetical protein